MLAVLICASCGKPPTEKQVELPSLDASSYAKGYGSLTKANFTETKVDCNHGDARLLSDLWKISRAAMNASAEPMIGETSIKPLRLADGEGKIAAIEVFYKPGDPGVTSRNVDVYVISSECRVNAGLGDYA